MEQQLGNEFNDNSQSCPCGMVFKDIESCTQHVLSCSNMDSDKLFCTICSANFARKDTFKRHFRRKHETRHTDDECLPSHKKIKIELSPVTDEGQTGPEDKLNIDDPMATIKQAVQALAGQGGHLLVLVGGQETVTWFGAGHGQTFPQDRPDIINQFAQYCRDKPVASSSTAKSLLRKPNLRPKRSSQLEVTTDNVDTAKLKKVDTDKKTETKNSAVKKKEMKPEMAKEAVVSVVKGITNTIANKSKVYKSKTNTNKQDDYGDSNNCDNEDEDDKEGNGDDHFENEGDDDDDYVDEIDDENTESDNYSDDTNNRNSKPQGLETANKKMYGIRPAKKVNTKSEGLRQIGRTELLKLVVEDLQKAEDNSSVNVSVVVRRRHNQGKVTVYTVPDLNKGKYQCQKCRYGFIWKRHLLTHQIKYPHCSAEEKFCISHGDILKEDVTYFNQDAGIEITATFQNLYDAQKNSSNFVCVICNMAIKNISNLLSHYVLHNTHEIFKCNICNQGFTSITSLSTHLKDHFLLPYECSTCNWRFESSSEFDRHQKNGCGHVSLLKTTKVTDKRYKCSVCKQLITGRSEFQEHVGLAHSNMTAECECDHCGLTFHQLPLYEQHIQQHGGSHPCPFCERTLPSKQALSDHIRQHRSKLREFMCYVCGKSYNNKRNFEVHLRMHTGEQPYKCNVPGCGKSFRSIDGLHQHRYTHNTERIVCDICGRDFKSPNRLNYHRKNHTIEWRWPCMFCDEKFKTLFTYKRHLANTHSEKKDEIFEKTNIRLYQCDICNKVYNDSENLRNHINNHKGIKPFKCKYCGKAFTDKSNKTYHEETHLGLRKLKCSICSRKFKQKEYLERHMEKVHKSSKEAVNQAVNESLMSHEKSIAVPETTIKSVSNSATPSEKRTVAQSMPNQTLPSHSIHPLSIEQAVLSHDALDMSQQGSVFNTGAMLYPVNASVEQLHIRHMAPNHMSLVMKTGEHVVAGNPAQTLTLMNDGLATVHMSNYQQYHAQ